VQIRARGLQTIDTDLCACQPSVYTFKLDFSNECTHTTVGGPGIPETACIVDGVGSNVIPISISQVQVFELSQTLQILGSAVLTGPFFDQDEISYTSITSVNEPGTIDPQTVPRGIQVSITGINSDEELLVNTWVILYSNDCGVFPVLDIGDIIGWTEFVCAAYKPLEWSERATRCSHIYYYLLLRQTNVGKPKEQFCPISGLDPSNMPSAPPTDAPSESPTDAQSEPALSSPSATPTDAPSEFPTDTPAGTLPTISPRSMPTFAPATVALTAAPSTAAQCSFGCKLLDFIRAALNFLTFGWLF